MSKALSQFGASGRYPTFLTKLRQYGNSLYEISTHTKIPYSTLLAYLNDGPPANIRRLGQLGLLSSLETDIQAGSSEAQHDDCTGTDLSLEEA